MKRIFKIMGIGGVCGILAVYVAEFVIGRYLIAQSGQFPAGMLVADKTRGLALSPGFDSVVERVRPFRVSVNRQGYRDRDWRGKKRPSILLVGSSATFGFGLEREAGIAAQLDQVLGSDVSVLNSAVYSYGPPQALATIRRECPAWRPRLIVYMHEYKMTRRDFLLNRGGGSGGSEVEDPVKKNKFGLRLPALRMFLSNHNLHPTQILERLWGLDRLSNAYKDSRYVTTGTWGNSCPDCTLRAAKDIAQMLQASEQCGANFLMALLPGPGEAYYGFKEPATTDLLKKISAINSEIPMLDLRRDIALGSVLNIPATDYFNRKASRDIAERIARHIRKSFPDVSAIPSVHSAETK